MNNLAAEMARYGITLNDVQNVLGCTDKTARNKVNGTTDFYVHEAMKLRDAYFPNMRIEYLFAKEPINTGV